MQVLQVHSLAKHLLWSYSTLGLSSSSSSSAKTSSKAPTSDESGSSQSSVLKSQEKEKKRRAREKEQERKSKKKGKKPKKYHYGKRTKTISERSKVMQDWKEAKKEKKRRDSSSSEELSSPTVSHIIQRRKEQQEVLYTTLSALVEAVDEILDKLSEQKVQLLTRIQSVGTSSKSELMQSVDEIKRLEWSLKPLRLQVLQSLQVLETDNGPASFSAEPLLSRFLFLQSQYDRMNA